MADSGNELFILARRVHRLGGAAPVEALRVRGGKVLWGGTRAEALAAAGPHARVLDLGDAVVTPGFADAHVHLITWALARRRVDLGGTASLTEALSRIRAHADEGGAWLRGQGWDANRWGALPTRAALDAVCADRPAYFESHDIHSAWLNSEALRRCGITRETPDPAGGEIVRDAATGEPTGVLKETAVRLAAPHLPVPDWEETRTALLEAQRVCHQLGLTGVHSVETDGLAHFAALAEQGELRLRVLQSLPLPRLDEAIDLGLRSGFGSEWLRIGGVKMFLDGALGSRTAWLREPYVGEPANLGTQTLPEPEFRDAVRRAAAAGIAATVHAIGDAAVLLALDVLSATAPPLAMPHRIEHLQLCPPEAWRMAARSGIVSSMQPVHLRSDIPAAEQFWGHARCHGAFAFAPLLRGGMTLAFGSDVPVETCDPREGLYAATRRVAWGDEDAGEEWFPDLRLSAEDAVRAYTEGPAAAAGEAHRRGRLLPGYDADLVAWDVDPLTAAPEALRSMRCLLTVVGGEVVHHAES